jgi:transcriptional regulator with XRE-family HTH domain
MSQKSPNETDKYIGARIRLRRTALGMSQERLGEILGLTFQQVQKYEKGTNRVGAGRLQAIADAFGVPISYFFEDRPGSSGAFAHRPELEAFLSSRDGVELAEAFVKIESSAMRRALIDLARAAGGS